MMRNWMQTNVQRDADAPAGGGAPAPDSGATPPASPPAAAPPAAVNPAAAAAAERAKVYDAQNLSDAERAYAEQLHAQYSELSAVQQAAMIAEWRQYKETEARAKAAPPAATPPAERTPPADKTPPAADDPHAGQIAKLEAQLTETQKVLAELKGERDKGEQARRFREQDQARQTAIGNVLKADPVLAELMVEPDEADHLASSALGYLARHLHEHGGSEKATLKAFIEKETRKIAKLKGMGAAELIADKIAARAAAGLEGGGPPPAQTTAKPDPKALERGEIGREILKEQRLS